MSTQTIRATATSEGCWIDGHWGQYGAARLVEIAFENGWDNAGGDDNLQSLAADKMYECGHPGVDRGLTEDDEDAIFAGSEDAERWLNDEVAIEGYIFGWYEGEFFYQPFEWWEKA